MLIFAILLKLCSSLQTHARHYLNPDDDPVEGHRLAQAIEMMEFIRASAASADVIFIGGDFNLEYYTTALRLLKRSLNLKDAWLDQVHLISSHSKAFVYFLLIVFCLTSIDMLKSG